LNKQSADGKSKRPKTGRIFSMRAMLWFIGIAMIVVAIGPFVFDKYTTNVLIRSFLYAVTVLTVDILWGYTGILTFGQSAFFGIGAYAAALTFTHLGFSPEMAALSFIGGIVVSMAVAWLVGWIAFWHRASPLYVAVLSLVLPIIVVQLLYSGGKFTGSSSGLVGFEAFDISVNGWFWIAGGLLITLTAIGWLFVHSDFGRVLVAIRENEKRCQFLGIDTTRIKIILMMAMAAVASIAGYVYACYTVVVAPEIAGFVFGTELVIYTALGGRATLIGPAIGAVLIDLTSAYLSGNLPFIWKLIVGTIFVAVIVVLPQGAAPVVKGLFMRLGAFFRRTPGQPAIGDIASLSTLAAVESPSSRPGGVTDFAALKTENLSRHYGSFKALDTISFEARDGELLSIVGPNGAGKTTLMQCISDGQGRSGGNVWINGQLIGRKSPQAVVKLGIGRSFQNTNMFESLNVSECLRLARYCHERPALFSRETDLALPGAAMRIIEATGLEAIFDSEARNLSHGQKRALELTMVLAIEPSVLLLDEPTAGLTKAERTLIGGILADLSRDDELCVLLIEHDLDFVRQVSSRVIVLHQGGLLMDGTVQEVVASDMVKAVYSGQHAIEEHQ